MSITRQLRRFAWASALACAVLLAVGASAAIAATDTAPEERYWASHGTPVASTGPVPEERYYQSYGTPQSLSLPESSTPSDGTPWVAIALSLAGALVIVAASALLVRRVRVRRRPAAQPTA